MSLHCKNWQSKVVKQQHGSIIAVGRSACALSDWQNTNRCIGDASADRSSRKESRLLPRSRTTTTRRLRHQLLRRKCASVNKTRLRHDQIVRHPYTLSVSNSHFTWVHPWPSHAERATNLRTARLIFTTFILIQVEYGTDVLVIKSSSCNINIGCVSSQWATFFFLRKFLLNDKSIYLINMC